MTSSPLTHYRGLLAQRDEADRLQREFQGRGASRHECESLGAAVGSLGMQAAIFHRANLHAIHREMEAEQQQAEAQATQAAAVIKAGLPPTPVTDRYQELRRTDPFGAAIYRSSHFMELRDEVSK